MALVPGLVAVLRIVPLVTRLLSGRRCRGCCPPACPPPPARSLVEETLEESLRGGHPAGPVRSGGCSSQSRAAWSRCRPRIRCSSLALAPPQDRENCHAGGNAFVLFDSFEPVTLCNLRLQKNNEVSFFHAERMIEGVRVSVTPVADFGPRMYEVSSAGARQRTRGCSPQGLGGVFALVQGL